jgi:hypothetical protein
MQFSKLIFGKRYCEPDQRRAVARDHNWPGTVVLRQCGTVDAHRDS